VLSNERVRNGVINRARRWPNKEVPFVIDDVFSEYCSINLRSFLRGVEGIIHVS